MHGGKIGLHKISKLAIHLK